jgi:hypothetical protein
MQFGSKKLRESARGCAARAVDGAAMFSRFSRGLGRLFDRLAIDFLQIADLARRGGEAIVFRDVPESARSSVADVPRVDAC